MDKAQELELDIQYVKSVLNKCSNLYSNILLQIENRHKTVNKRTDFICFQLKSFFNLGKSPGGILKR